MDSFLIYNKATTSPSLVTGGYISASGLSTIDINTSDLSYVGTHNLYVVTVVTNSNEELEQQDLDLTIIDSCATTTLVGAI